MGDIFNVHSQQAQLNRDLGNEIKQKMRYSDYSLSSCYY